jgi:hypothetical protein
LVFQAGDVTSWVNASVKIGTCDTAMNAALSAGNVRCEIGREMLLFYLPVPLLSGLNALEAYGKACSIVAQLSPVSSANAAI